MVRTVSKFCHDQVPVNLVNVRYFIDGCLEHTYNAYTSVVVHTACMFTTVQLNLKFTHACACTFIVCKASKIGMCMYFCTQF